MSLNLLSKGFTAVFGSRNDRLIKAYRKRVIQINSLEPSVRRLTDPELKAKTVEFKARHAKGERIAAIMPEVMAVARETMDRAVGIRNILNPEAGFDPALLSAEARPLYDQAVAQAAATPPIEELGHSTPVPGWQQIDLPVQLYEAVRAIYPHSRPPFRARPFDVQLIGGMVLGEGKIAEMKTGEGKTIVAPLACYVACVEGLQCYVVTVNDYLVQRDRDWVFPFYFHAGLTVGAIHPFHMQPAEGKQAAYRCNTVYGTNSEFGFDYLRDNMKHTTADQVQKHRDFCIIDEVDSILIDEARTPLIISGPAHEDAPRYDLADDIARHLIQRQREWDAADVKVQQIILRAKGLEGDIRNTRDKAKIPAMREEMRALQLQRPELEAVRDRFTRYYEVEREKKATHLTHDGIAEAQKKADIGSFYVGGNMEFPHLLENALRAHVVYQGDKDYVVQNGEVVIVDEFTGRLMIGRQWSDGLHQAIEAKEKVKIKEETQTLATVTIQNFFRLFKRLAGMTGTAITEGTEFHEIYKLDVVCIPTNLPVIRLDRDDLIYLNEGDKWEAILDEIKQMHDVGRPVLVGTTSVEHSQKLSQMLQRKYGIKHEVLNAKQHDREATIVAHAGELGAVMIATNMAGRGTDIKLQPISRELIVRHWQARNLLPRDARPDMTDEQLLAMAHRHIAPATLGLKKPEVDAMDDAALRLALLRQWTTQFTHEDPAKVPQMGEAACLKALEQSSGFILHKLAIYKHVEEMGGLHIVGTERHEARRIDNQLRGRAGRQGDRGSSRFFISLEDDLMKMFAGKATLMLLSKLGMKEGEVLEHKMLTRSVERAQRKVEERNYQIRKNLLEYDEVMEFQRNTFYGIRQDVLEGRKVDRIILDYIAEAVEDATALYLDRDYTPGQIAEWCKQNLEVMLEAYKLRTNELKDLQHIVAEAAAEEVRQTIDVTLGEYMSNSIPPEEWDVKGLAGWASQRFAITFNVSQLRQMNPDQVKEQLTDQALEQLSKKDLAPLEKFLDPLYAQKGLAEWVRTQFNVEVDPKKIADLQQEASGTAAQRAAVARYIVEKAEGAYREREVVYPVDYVLDIVFNMAQQNGPFAAQQLAGWANQRYEINWTGEQVMSMSRDTLSAKLIEAGKEWYEGPRLPEMVERTLAQNPDAAALAQWVKDRLGQEINDEEAAELKDPAKRRDLLVAKGRAMLRSELTQLERYVLLQILDTAWKDHLYAMDHLKDSVGLRGYAERDPRIEYKREGSNLFNTMQQIVRDRVTELIFRVKLSANAEVRNVYTHQKATHVTPIAATTAAAAEAGKQGEAGEGAESEQVALSRKARRAAAKNEGEAEEGDGEGDDRPQFKDRRKKSR
ncbi:MAG: preprotein translocase subunit SecA [Planctomycetota bacterium]|nr:preprotein translocase subunit SecA [Planctomycetota bacterium]